MKPNFTESELYVMQDIMIEDRKRWSEKHPDDSETLECYDSIISKFQAWSSDEVAMSRAIRSLINPKQTL